MADVVPIPTDPAALLRAVLAANSTTPDERLREVLDELIRHIHAFAAKVQLTPAELHTGLDFLVAIGQASGPKKHEGILLSDLLGLSTLVQLQDARESMAAGATEPALIGPFWRADQPLLPNGARICTADTPGTRMRVTGRVLSLTGTPIANARVETWQASPAGLYENQDEHQPDRNLRGAFLTDKDGRFAFETVRPAGYPVPVDGPCGDLLRAQRRSTMRPAHLHFAVLAPGYRFLATQIFDIDDPHAGDDAVFGTVGSLLRKFEPDGEGGFAIDVTFRLREGELQVPPCPIP